MLYLGNFNYSDINEEADNYVNISLVVEAADVDAALDAFEKRLRDAHDNEGLFPYCEKIYLDAIVELESAPSTPVFTNYLKLMPMDDGICTISAASPDGQDSEDMQVFLLEDMADEHDHGHEEAHEHSHDESDEFEPLAAQDLVDLDFDELGEDQEAFIDFTR